MEFEFDKEMDAMLRQAAKGEPVSVARDPNLQHLDADEISAFAENALPNKARIRITKHLGDCDSCRISLSNLIVLNSEAETSVASSAVSAKETEIAATSIPWFRKLFAFQNLTYGLGALVLLFAGFTAFVLIQNFNKNRGSEVATVSDTKQKMSDAPAQVAENEFDYSANEMASDQTNSNVVAANEPQTDAKESDIFGNDLSGRKEPSILDQKNLPSDGKPELLRREDRNITSMKNKPSATPSTDDYVAKRMPPPPPKIVGETSSEADTKITVDGIVVEEMSAEKAERKQQEPASPITTRGNEGLSDKEKSRSKNKKDSDERDAGDVALSSGGRQVGGKTFARNSGIWVDTAYKNQATTTVRRGTSEYGKLDSGLRSIADKLGGTVVIIWKSKAYKIQ